VDGHLRLLEDGWIWFFSGFASALLKRDSFWTATGLFGLCFFASPDDDVHFLVGFFPPRAPGNYLDTVNPLMPSYLSRCSGLGRSSFLVSLSVVCSAGASLVSFSSPDVKLSRVCCGSEGPSFPSAPMFGRQRDNFPPLHPNFSRLWRCHQNLFFLGFSSPYSVQGPGIWFPPSFPSSLCDRNWRLVKEGRACPLSFFQLWRLFSPQAPCAG